MTCQRRDRDRAAQAAFAEQQRLALNARIRHAARLNPDLPTCLLAERFGVDERYITRVCVGIPRERDYFADLHNPGRRRRRGA